MRITTNAILRNYKSNLGASLTNLDSARTKVMTGRQFSSAAEDPGRALRAASLEKKYLKNLDYLTTVKDVQSYQDAQEDSAMQISDLALTLSKDYGLEALNGTNGTLEVRQSFAEAWRSAQESMVFSLNASYEGAYIFGGSANTKPPFELTTKDDGTQILTYRGIDVNDPANAAVLDELSKETNYVDLGFGLIIDKANGNAINESSAFNTNLPGINLVGYGQDKDGRSENMILLAGQIADVLEKEPFDQDEYKKLLSNFEDGRNNILNQVTTLGTKTDFLTTTEERLESSKLSLATQIDNVVNIDMADAITQYSWAQYAYNAALKVGTSILSPSFIDFMN